MMNHISFYMIALLLGAALCVGGCSRTAKAPAGREAPAPEEEALPDLAEEIGRLAAAGEPQSMGDALEQALAEAEIPPAMASVVRKAARGPAFILDLLAILGGDPFLYRLVDKTHPLPEGYEPLDLVKLTGGSYRVGRGDLFLRRPAAEGLEKMAAAAKLDGVTLTASSAYRSYAYQVGVYERNVRELGQAAADRESARPGYSQHQTGLVVDFGSITDEFAETAAGRWLAANAGAFGWSISFPQGYESVTGYRWECWHYRYVGVELAAFIDAYFGGIQQYALQFIHAWAGE